MPDLVKWISSAPLEFMRVVGHEDVWGENGFGCRYLLATHKTDS